jgi:citrate lyase subunit beta / citryl-CoA lyase
MKLRSLLFVPGDRPDRFAKAAASGADAIIIDLEDSVGLDRKIVAREAAAEYLSGDRPVPVFVRVNPQDSHLTHDDLASVLPYMPDAIVLPKTEGARSINWLRAEAAAVADSQDGEAPPILPIATETPGAVFDLGTLREVAHYLAGVSWGAEDLPASVGAPRVRWTAAIRHHLKWSGRSRCLQRMPPALRRLIRCFRTSVIRMVLPRMLAVRRAMVSPACLPFIRRRWRQ